mmetsp:Transcript_19/g.51  ORF Transcript_19/g.51 Transcript_19/m.51 type:complete len:224 (-) Transcript_19:517-1188(-)
MRTTRASLQAASQRTARLLRTSGGTQRGPSNDQLVQLGGGRACSFRARRRQFPGELCKVLRAAARVDKEICRILVLWAFVPDGPLHAQDRSANGPAVQKVPASEEQQETERLKDLLPRLVNGAQNCPPLCHLALQEVYDCLCGTRIKTGRRLICAKHCRTAEQGKSQAQAPILTARNSTRCLISDQRARNTLQARVPKHGFCCNSRSIQSSKRSGETESLSHG